MKICAVIPSHNHYQNIGKVVDGLTQLGLPVFIVDDGSAEPAQSALAALHNGKNIITHRLDVNGGKGAAVIAGFHLASAGGYSHVLQIDADGQHDLAALPRLLEAAAQNPHAVISGQPIYDASIPAGRKIGRWVTHIWVWIETLSFRISDSMCGFRIYPLDEVQKLLAQEKLGQRMDFDTDIMVRLFWRGVAPVMVPVKVIYPSDNTSNFDVWRDNGRISKMHARLFLTMVYRLPKILAHRPPAESSHWASLRERGVYGGIRFCAESYRLLGHKAARIILMPIVLYFYLSGKTQRHAIRQFLTRALKRPPTMGESFQNFMNFAMRALDVFAAWTGGIHADAVVATNPVELERITSDPRGGLFIVSHLGNTDIARAVLDKKTRDRLTILVHTRHAENYHRIMRKFSPESAVNMVQVTDIGPETIIHLKQRVEQGEWITVAGDRIAVLSTERSVSAPFMGAEADFPQGAWVMGALLECPVYLLFCLQEGDQYRFTIEPFADNICLPRSERAHALQGYAARYAERLEHYSMKAPFQWYNFYNFWAR